MDADQNLGEAKPRLSDADDDLNAFDSKQYRDETARAPELQHLRPREQQNRRPEGDVRGPTVQVLQQFRVEAVARRSSVASVRSRTRRQHSNEDGHGERASRDGGKRTVPGRQCDGCTARPGIHAIDKDGRQYNKHDGEHEVQTDHIGVQVREHADPANNGLGRDAEADNEREFEEFGTLAAHANDHEEHPDRNRDQNEGQQSVTKLDNAVDAHLRGRDEGISRTSGPGRAAKAGACQSHGAAGAYDQNL